MYWGDVFLETARGLQSALRRTGVDSVLVPGTRNQSRDRRMHILVGANYMRHLPRRYIVYQMEQITSPWITPKYETVLAAARCVWDFSPANVEHWQAKGLRTAYVPVPIAEKTLLSTMKMYQEHPLSTLEDGVLSMPSNEGALETYENSTRNWDAERPVDVLFYGASNNRRKQYARRFSDAAEGNDLIIRFALRYQLFGEQREMAIQQAKVVLNIHFYEGASLEVHRINHLLAHGKAIVSERSSDVQLDDIYEKRGAVFFASMDTLVPDVLALLEDVNTRLKMEQNSLSLAQQLAWDTGNLESGLELAGSP